jgi:choline dehydrogenase-like flavoprotein
VPALVGAAIAAALNWRFMTRRSAADDRRSPPRGRVVAAHPSMHGVFRGQPQDYDDWAAAGNPGWSWREVLPYFLRSEHNEDYRGSPYHGLGGPICVSHIRKPNPLNQSFLEAFASVGGYAPCDDFTGPRPEGYGLRQGTIRDGRRDSTAAAHPAAGARASEPHGPRARVTRVLIENGRARNRGARRRRCAILSARETVLKRGRDPVAAAADAQGWARRELRRHGIDDGAAVGTHYQITCPPVLLETANTLSYGCFAHAASARR